MRKMTITIAIASLAATPAFAQDALPGVGKIVSDLATGAMGGMQKGSQAESRLALTRPSRDDVMTSNLVGATVYNNNGDTVGKVEDIAIANGKSVAGVVVGVGGFLGIGDSYVLVNPASFSYMENEGTTKLFLNASKETLKDAPKFTYKKH